MQGLQQVIFVYTIINVEITFDPLKDGANLAKHGVSLTLAEEFEWETAITWPDARRNYSESRMAWVIRGYMFTGVGKARARYMTTGEAL